MQRFSLAEIPLTPWRNGKGLTREIALGRWDGTSIAQEWDWRLSVASINADGTFSSFAGVDRIAVLIDGTVRLESTMSKLSWAEPGESHSFCGEEEFTAQLCGEPARFFNVMFRRERTQAIVTTHRGDAILAASEDARHCLLTLHGIFVIDTPAGEEVLNADEGLLCPSPHAALHLRLASQSGCLVEARLRRCPGVLKPSHYSPK
jgi:environmental stress-induced protein Ves